MCLGTSRHTFGSLPALVCCSVAIMTSPTNMNVKKGTSIRLWIVISHSSWVFLFSYFATSLSVGTASSNGPIVHPPQDRYMSGYGQS